MLSPVTFAGSVASRASRSSMLRAMALIGTEHSARVTAIADVLETFLGRLALLEAGCALESFTREILTGLIYPGKTPDMTDQTTYTAFAGSRRVAGGDLQAVLRVLKGRFDREESEPVLVFDDLTGEQCDFNLRGSIEDVLARAAPSPPRGPGRPKLGVTSREVSLLPRHWEWLERQASGLSGTLRRLVEQASRDEPPKERALRIRGALSRFLTSMAGDRPHYEEATRALFNGDVARFEALVRKWPKDIREYAMTKAVAASRAAEPTGGATGAG